MTLEERNKKAMQDNTAEATEFTDALFASMATTVIGLPLIRSYIQRCEVEAWSMAMKRDVKICVQNSLSTYLTYVIGRSTSQWKYGEKALRMGLSGRVPRHILRDAIGKGMFAHREKAMTDFLNRKVNSLTLSARVWNLTPIIREQIEQTVQVGILNGESHQEIAKNLKQYLNAPDKLFRRVRDAEGNLHLSKSAENYHPDTGVYRSSQKNAERLARNEINKAYRTAEWNQMQNLDFVVGYEIKRSGAAKYPCEICDMMTGKYPKSFRWSGNHVNCMCFVVPILKTNEEFFQYDTNGGHTATSENEVREIPAALKQWLKSNKNRYRVGSVDWIDENPEALKYVK